MAKKSARILNGYRLLYLPDHHAAMQSKNWLGYVYEHVLVAEEMIGRRVRKDELIHHFDGNGINNKRNNVMVMLKSQHGKLHAWFARGAPGIERFGIKRVEHISARVKNRRHCVICNEVLTGNQRKYCSNACKGLALRRTKRPLKATLVRDMKKMGWSAMGRKYGVSDNAVRKWAKNYELL